MSRYAQPHHIGDSGARPFENICCGNWLIVLTARKGRENLEEQTGPIPMLLSGQDQTTDWA